MSETAPTTDSVLVERRGHALWITLNRPEARNALDWESWTLLRDAWNLLVDDPDLWVGVITATGERAFSAGADLKKLPAQIAELRAQGVADPRPPVGFNERFCDKPVIAALNGDALGGGLEIALAADIRIAADHVRVGLPESRWGAIPGAGGTQRIVRTVAPSKALELLFTAQIVDAATAADIGLVDHVVPAAELIAATESLVERIESVAPVANRAIKRAVYRGLDAPLTNGFTIEAEELRAVMDSEDYANNITAFATGQPPHWTGR